MIHSLNVIMLWVIFLLKERPFRLDLLCVCGPVLSSVSFPQLPLQVMKKWTQMHRVAEASFSAPMKRLMLLDSIKNHFPMGHQWQYTQMRRVCLPGLHSQSVLPQADHSGGSSSQHSALMCMHLCHIIQPVLQLTPTWHLNSLTNRVVMPWWHNCCSNWILYAALIQTRLETCRLVG